MIYGDGGILVEWDGGLGILYILFFLLSATGANKVNWEKTIDIAITWSLTDHWKYPNCLSEPRRAILRRKIKLARKSQGKNMTWPCRNQTRIYIKQRVWTVISNDASMGWLILGKRNNHWPMKLKAVVVMKVFWDKCKTC